MNDGRIEQVGPPEAVYESPANAFVAEFVGTSNRLPATVSGDQLDLGHATVRAPPSASDGDVTVVARPEAFERGGPVTATIEDRFYLGDHVRAAARLPDGAELTLRFDPAEAPDDDRVDLALDADRVHLLQA
jgi:putative spermidine/putrescine transport system ATP-binding protein